MGFDDIVFKYEIKEKTIETLRPLIGKYKYENWDKIEEMETGEMCYSAYSLIFKQIHSINYVMAQGTTPFPLTDEHKQHIIKLTRSEVLMIFYDEVEDEDIQEKIEKHLEPLI
jgi:ferric iron reductase protein FhuF